MQSRISILVVERDALFRLGLMSLLSRSPEFDVAGDPASLEGTHQRVAELRPDVVILDAGLPGTTPAEFQRWVRQASPKSAIVVLTASEVEADLASALQAGISGYVLRDSAFWTIEQAVQQCSRGYTFVSEELLVKFEADDVRRANAATAQSDCLRTTALSVDEFFR